MAALTTNVVPLDGLRYDDLFVAASAGGDDCDTGPGVELLVDNADASPHTVTLVTPRTIDGLAVADRAVVVAAGTDEIIPVGHEYQDTSTGRASITYDAVTSLNVAVIRVPVS